MKSNDLVEYRCLRCNEVLVVMKNNWDRELGLHSLKKHREEAGTLNKVYEEIKE